MRDTASGKYEMQVIKELPDADLFQTKAFDQLFADKGLVLSRSKRNRQTWRVHGRRNYAFPSPMQKRINHRSTESMPGSPSTSEGVMPCITTLSGLNRASGLISLWKVSPRSILVPVILTADGNDRVLSFVESGKLCVNDDVAGIGDEIVLV